MYFSALLFLSFLNTILAFLCYSCNEFDYSQNYTPCSVPDLAFVSKENCENYTACAFWLGESKSEGLLYINGK